ncbi:MULTISPECIES: YcfL family protein [unclassified Pseudomonas]|uniref:YcfL family protein n=1 Tax=unclassified Pseudomonas TaxID=196821 RepID=UPI002AC929E2|nr:MULTISPECIES: YcfL family protein [unclassified Pseudomonas]MEB0040258.1 YcfL family protein [Pseudomonas sp. MH10]MEB0077454.1 YcfL family protein [Pseudomonas sp. MH10out]MEB0092301.1 YcfL family protein [Pseudomonas sp. CCI4.2]MEB0101091.1 YcfL family protein [Pseudomonas sp. CCI3.2]MEB0123110.1 YcfL family protein [Pseudomonas sp. CCI1.2]
MRIKIFGLMAAALLIGCATPPPAPAPGSAASKVMAMGKLKDIDVGAMRVARENGFLTVKAALSNTSSSNTTLYYRFAWLGNDGFPVADEETWKSLTLYGSQTSFLTSIAPVPRATDFRIEVKTP